MTEYFLYKMLFYNISLWTFLLRLVWYLEGTLETAGQYSHGLSLVLSLSNAQNIQHCIQDRISICGLATSQT